MLKIIFIVLIISGCATDASREYERARLEANPNYADESNQTEVPVKLKANNQNFPELFECYLKYGSRFNRRDTRFICD